MASITRATLPVEDLNEGECRLDVVLRALSF